MSRWQRRARQLVALSQLARCLPWETIRGAGRCLACLAPLVLHFSLLGANDTDGIERPPGGPSAPAARSSGHRPSPRERKYEQSTECSQEGTGYFSNHNSSEIEYIHYDDFRCKLTGDIVTVSFRGGMWATDDKTPCPLNLNLQSIEIAFLGAVERPHCEWLHTELLCTNTIPLDELETSFVCIGRIGEEIYEFTARLPQPFVQTEGYRYGFRIAANLRDRDVDCVFYLQGAAQQREGRGYSYNPADETRSCNQDTVFSLFTRPEACPADFDESGAVGFDDLLNLLASWGDAEGIEDLDGSGFVDAGDLLILLASWGPCA